MLQTNQRIVIPLCLHIYNLIENYREKYPAYIVACPQMPKKAIGEADHSQSQELH